VLERAGLVASGEGKFWKRMINRSAEEMKDECLRSGKKWKDGPAELTFDGEPDASFVDREETPVGKLAQNEAFRERMQSLLRPKETPGERPFYVSSPFFSRMGRMNEKEA
jgi:hypothetical protein